VVARLQGVGCALEGGLDLFGEAEQVSQDVGERALGAVAVPGRQFVHRHTEAMLHRSHTDRPVPQGADGRQAEPGFFLAADAPARTSGGHRRVF
jgi:hypothetical protein